MMKVYLDIGNSALKWNIDPDPGAAPSRLALGDDLAARLQVAWAPLAAPAAVIACSVAAARHYAAVEQVSRRLWSIAPRRIEARAEGHGVTNCYRQPRQLGADRWAALVGARALGVLPAVVVDCGTAWTIDALDRNGVFTGGAILASPQLAADALARHATGIAPVTMEGSCSYRGVTTAESVRGGALLGAAGGVERVLARLAEDFGETPLYLCGGGAQWLLDQGVAEFVHCPGLVLHGLSVSGG